MNDKKNEYFNEEKPIFVICGSAGMDDSLEDKSNRSKLLDSENQQYSIYFDSSNTGICEVEIINDLIQGRFINTFNNEVLDSFKLYKKTEN